jgi:DNA-binding response OmpR family regulator
MARILVVNDERDLVELCQVILEEVGHQVTTLTNGAKAVELAEHDPPDLIALDWVLGRLTGEDVLRALRANPATAHIPILLLSALPDLEARAGVLGADGALGKPFGEDELVRAVGRLLPGDHQREPRYRERAN